MIKKPNIRHYSLVSCEVEKLTIRDLFWTRNAFETYLVVTLDIRGRLLIVFLIYLVSSLLGLW